MKVTGPGQGQGAPGAADATSATDAAKPATVEGDTFADKLEAGQAGGAAEPTRLQGAAFDRAIEQVLERVIEEQLGPGAGAQVPAAVRENLRAALRETLESDPFLAEKLRAIQET